MACSFSLLEVYQGAFWSWYSVCLWRSNHFLFAFTKKKFCVCFRSDSELYARQKAHQYRFGPKVGFIRGLSLISGFGILGISIPMYVNTSRRSSESAEQVISAPQASWCLFIFWNLCDTHLTQSKTHQGPQVILKIFIEAKSKFFRIIQIKSQDLQPLSNRLYVLWCPVIRNFIRCRKRMLQYLIRNLIRFRKQSNLVPNFFEKVPYKVPQTVKIGPNFFEKVPYKVPQTVKIGTKLFWKNTL